MRRLRDLLRSAILRGTFPGGVLPTEAELMASYGATRATVRETLAVLRREGLIDRRPGVGTHVVVKAVMTQLVEAHGVEPPGQESLLNRRLRARELDRSMIPLPHLAADRLGVPAGVPCLRLEYVSLFGDEPHGMATNYVLNPEAGRMRDQPFVHDWYALLNEAGVGYEQSEFVCGCAPADAATAALLGIAEGSPLITIEQVISDASGRPFNLAYIHVRGDRFLFVSSAARRH
ncbi:GntR family transcriptional regulator [Nonomuraea sp. K274]|uniref:GntR family transcriptional regulator n=1 Tax=Nonomuraea cypriaca TaxID=1187855 RepID=A0A931ANF9_9ACTN|nr:GntR family transcriptional regulator [Nonomuraea cypriaca]